MKDHGSPGREQEEELPKRVVPKYLPWFRGKNGLTEPEEFLSVFKRACRAARVLQIYLAELMTTCLKNIDAKWMDSWIQHHSTQSQIWTEVHWAFWSHFEDPNATTIWLMQIQKLRMGENRAQRFMDQFKSFATKLKWNLQEEDVIYQFKMGLPQWILTQLSTAELNFILMT